MNALHAAQAYLERLILPIEPRKQFPSNSFTGSNKIPVPNCGGLCLSKYGDPGYGTLVKQGKYGTSPGFCEELLGKSAAVLQAVVQEHQITALTCVPSLRSTIVADFAEALAQRLGLPFVQLLEKSGARQQKDMENSYHQCRNAWESFACIPDIPLPDRVILVDDIVDSRWTMTVCGYLLTQAGCELVFPFALADSSEKKGRDT